MFHTLSEGRSRRDLSFYEVGGDAAHCSVRPGGMRVFLIGYWIECFCIRVVSSFHIQLHVFGIFPLKQDMNHALILQGIFPYRN